ALLGTPTGIFHRVIGKLVPPIVGGAIIIVVGIALMPVALKESVFAVHGAGSVGSNILLAAVTAVLLVGCMMAGIRMGANGTWLRFSSVVIALAGGCILAAFLGRFSLQSVADAGWFTTPRIAFVNFDVSFSVPAIL